MTTIHPTQLDKLATLIATGRADWDTPGIRAALQRAATRATSIWTLTSAAARAAADPTNRTPAIIAMDGPHWRPTDDRPPAPNTRRCTTCRAFHRNDQPHQRITRQPPTEEYLAARQQLRETP